MEHFNTVLEKITPLMSYTAGFCWLCRCYHNLCFHPFSPASSPSLWSTDQHQPARNSLLAQTNQQRGKIAKKDKWRLKWKLWQQVSFLSLVFHLLCSSQSSHLQRVTVRHINAAAILAHLVSNLYAKCEIVMLQTWSKGIRRQNC